MFSSVKSLGRCYSSHFTDEQVEAAEYLELFPKV